MFAPISNSSANLIPNSVASKINAEIVAFSAVCEFMQKCIIMESEKEACLLLMVVVKSGKSPRESEAVCINSLNISKVTRRN